jgi:hypothetical protein
VPIGITHDGDILQVATNSPLNALIWRSPWVNALGWFVLALFSLSGDTQSRYDEQEENLIAAVQ